jgi:hypothetical protein
MLPRADGIVEVAIDLDKRGVDGSDRSLDNGLNIKRLANDVG